MISQRWEYWSIREMFRHLFHRFLNYQQIMRFRLIPHIMRHQITRPNDIIEILKKSNANKILLSRQKNVSP